MINLLNTEILTFGSETVRILHIPFLIVGGWTVVLILKLLLGGKNENNK